MKKRPDGSLDTLIVERYQLHNIMNTHAIFEVHTLDSQSFQLELSEDQLLHMALRFLEMSLLFREGGPFLADHK